jgi:hypothetical protein
MLQRVSLRIPIDLSANKIGKQLLLVRNGDDANTATLRFQSQLKDMGVDLSQTGRCAVCACSCACRSRGGLPPQTDLSLTGGAPIGAASGLQGIAKEVLKQIEAKQKLEADAQVRGDWLAVRAVA